MGDVLENHGPTLLFGIMTTVAVIGFVYLVYSPRKVNRFFTFTIAFLFFAFIQCTTTGQTWPSQGDKLRGAPTQLFEEILAQKELCNQVLRSKNNLIEMLEGENRVVDEGYKELIGEYHTNISVLSGRMEYHMHSFSKLLESERLNLEVAFNQQKSQQLAKGEEGWQALLDKAAKSSEEQMKARLDLVEEQEVEMDELIINDYEQLGETKQKMEWSIRNMEEQIEMIQVEKKKHFSKKILCFK